MANPSAAWLLTASPNTNSATKKLQASQSLGSYSGKPKLSKIKTGEYGVDKLQDNLLQYFDTLFQYLPLLDGRLLTDIEFTADAIVSVTHGLGRTPRGYLPVKASGEYGSLYDSQSENPTPNTTILLTATRTATLSLWIF